MTPTKQYKGELTRGLENVQKSTTTDKSKNNLERIRLWLMAAGVLASAAALFCAAYGINQQHEWYRRHFAAEMIREWNEQSSTHKAEIENAYPESLSRGRTATKPASDH